MDIQTRDDLEKLMRHFYTSAIVDVEIGHYFSDVHPIDLEKHIPIFLDFWETSVFGEGKYKNNLFDVHFALHEKSAFKASDFEQWLTIFNQSVDDLFEGEKANQIKFRAWQIALSFQSKLSLR